MYLIYTCTYAIDEHMFFPVFFSISFQTPLFPTNSSHLRWMLTIHGDQNTGYFAVLPDMFFPIKWLVKPTYIPPPKPNVPPPSPPSSGVLKLSGS